MKLKFGHINMANFEQNQIKAQNNLAYITIIFWFFFLSLDHDSDW